MRKAARSHAIRETSGPETRVSLEWPKLHEIMVVALIEVVIPGADPAKNL